MKNKTSIIIVNAVTMTRVIGTLLMPFIYNRTSSLGLGIYLICLLLTDTIDGFLARKLHATTVFGALLDAIADKLLGIATLAVFARSYPIMILPILSEIIITFINTRGAAVGAVADSSTLGKIKTWVLGLAIVFSFGTINAPEIIELISGFSESYEYLLDFFNNVNTHKESIMTILSSISVGAGIMVACDYQIRIRNEAKKAKEAGFVFKEIKLKKGKELIHALFNEEYYQKNKKEPFIKKIGVINNEKIN